MPLFLSVLIGFTVLSVWPVGPVVCTSYQGANEKTTCDSGDYRFIKISHFSRNNAVKKILPHYPSEAANASIESVVSVKVLVGVDGKVIKACIVQGDEIFYQAVNNAVMKWKFRRNFGIKNLKVGENEKIAASDVIVFNFTLTPRPNVAGIQITPK
jgi:outer membrane biosynthesis protein TonB